MTFSNEQLLETYEYLRYSRSFGDRIIYYIKTGKIAGAIHSPRGQEGIQAGLIMAAKYSPHKTYCAGTHRDQPANTKRLGLQLFMDEMLCRSTGINNGLAGEYHLISIEHGVLPAQGILGGVWPWCAGFAWARRQKGEKSVVIAVYGEGACSEGATYEAMNIASIYKLPMVFFIENNGYAMSTPIAKESATEDLALRAQGAGMRGITVDGNDPIAVTEALLEAIDLAANGEPNVLEVKTLRWEGHFVGDMQTYRDPKYRETLDEICPILRFEKKLKDLGVIDDATIERVTKEQDDIIVAAFEKGFTQPHPTEAEVLNYNAIYSNDAGGAI